MMGKSHSLSGAVGWLAGCAAFSAAGLVPSATVVGVGAAVSAGFALLPDIDHPGSTVARTLGPITRGIARGVAWIAGRTRVVSCRHCSTGPDRGGHRGLTHTAVGALLTGAVTAALGLLYGKPAGLAVVGFAVWLAAHAALSSKTRAKVGDWVLPGKFRARGKLAFRFTAAVGALLVALLAVGLLNDTPGTGWWWIGLPVAWGCIAHSLGDAMTYTAVPLLWPLEIRGCRWRTVGTPHWMRFRTGSRTETVIVVLMLAAGLGLARTLAGAA